MGRLADDLSASLAELSLAPLGGATRPEQPDEPVTTECHQADDWMVDVELNVASIRAQPKIGRTSS